MTLPFRSRHNVRKVKDLMELLKRRVAQVKRFSRSALGSCAAGQYWTRSNGIYPHPMGAKFSSPGFGQCAQRRLGCAIGCATIRANLVRHAADGAVWQRHGPESITLLQRRALARRRGLGSQGRDLSTGEGDQFFVGVCLVAVLLVRLHDQGWLVCLVELKNQLGHLCQLLRLPHGL
jgi:hypothetical protein